MYRTLTRTNEENHKYDMAIKTNDLCSTILDAKTNLALVQSELAKIKTDRELNK
jgi:hypothetical protein